MQPTAPWLQRAAADAEAVRRICAAAATHGSTGKRCARRDSTSLSKTLHLRSVLGSCSVVKVDPRRILTDIGDVRWLFGPVSRPNATSNHRSHVSAVVLKAI